MLRCPETRNSVLEFLQHILTLNTKKTRLHVSVCVPVLVYICSLHLSSLFTPLFQVDYRKFTSHGFMLNLLHVLQQLSLKVKLKMVSCVPWPPSNPLLPPLPSPPTHTLPSLPSLPSLLSPYTHPLFTLPPSSPLHTPKHSRLTPTTSTTQIPGLQSAKRHGSTAPRKSLRKNRKS